MNALDDAISISSDDDPEYDIHTDDFFKDKIEFLLNSNNPRDKEVLNLMTINAAQTNDAALYIQLLSKGYQVHVLNDKGQTAMHIAFYHDSDDLVLYAIEDDVTYQDIHVNYSDCNGLTHLHIACDYWSEESDKLAREYLKSGANIDASFEVDPKGLRSGFTPLHMCVTSDNSKNSIDLLLEYGANVMAKDKMGRTPLHLLCSVYGLSDDSSEESKSLKRMALLLENGSDVNAKDDEGNTPLHSVFLVGHKEGLPYYFSDKRMYQKYKLLRDYQPDVTASNNAGNTVLHCVIMNLKYSRCSSDEPSFDDSMHAKIIDEIFSSREDIDVNAQNAAGETFLQIAVSMLSVDIVSYLIKRNAQVSDGRYCFYEPNFLPNLETVRRAVTIIDLLLEKGFEFPVIDQLSFLQFLVQDNRNLSWMNVLHRSKIEAYLDNLLNFGTFDQVQRVYTQMALTLLGRKQTHLKNKMYKFAKRWFRCKRRASLFFDVSVIGFLGLIHVIFESDKAKKYFSTKPKLMKELKDEYKNMKTTFVNDNITVLSLLEEHPNDIYQRIKDVDLQNLANKFTVYKSIVEGHFTKALIRNCLEKLVHNDYMKKLLYPALPDICCRMIYFYLDNEDILNIFSAAICVN